jgi:hypothetical protein
MMDWASMTLAEKLEHHEVIEVAIQKAAREAVFVHARLGRPVAGWRDGRVVWIEPAEILAQFAVDPSSAQAG